jgi:Ala-tRNA(Pro) deacylase
MTEQVEAQLDDGTVPATADDLLQRLTELGITAHTIDHPPVFTVEEAKALRGEITGCHTKSLFLRNKKGAMWLVICPEDKPVNLKSLGTQLGAGRFSFCSKERLMKYLGLIPGAVTPFGVINDKGHKVKVVLDRSMFENEPLNFHPLDNAKTTSVSGDGLIKFLEAENHTPQIIKIEP